MERLLKVEDLADLASYFDRLADAAASTAKSARFASTRHYNQGAAETHRSNAALVRALVQSKMEKAA